MCLESLIRNAVAVLICGLAPLAAYDFPVPPPPEEAPAVASYTIEARFLPEEHAAEATEVLTWRSPAAVPVESLLFHLYLNGFSNEATTWFLEEGVPPDDHPVRPDEWGYTEVRKMELLDEEGNVTADLTPGLTFVRPDDGNEADRTLLSVPLPEPVPPGGTARVRIEFLSRLPRFVARTGYRGDFHFFGQWFPKVAVWEPEGMRGRSPGGWNARQYHAYTEYYADYGDYDVRLTVPAGWKVGATGLGGGPPEAASGGEETHRFRQPAVHDFAWFAGPRIESETRTFEVAAWRDAGEEAWLVEEVGVAAADLDLPAVEVTLFHPREHRHLVDRQFEAVFKAILYYGYWFGPYPYPTLTVLDPPHMGDEEGPGGMEYPTLITGGARLWSPAARLSPEYVLVHEFGHQVWYGLVGSNEFDEAWLDEGLNTYATVRVLGKAWGPNRAVTRFGQVPVLGIPLVEAPGEFPGWTEEGGWLEKGRGALHLRPFGVPRHPLLDLLREVPWLTYVGDVAIPSQHARRKPFLRDPAIDPIARESWRSYSYTAYRVNSYDKPTQTLWSLERVVGPAAMIRGLRAFALAYRYGHPSTHDFVRVFQEAVGRDLRWFFDPLVFGAGTVDFAVGRVEQREARRPLGVFFQDGEKLLRTGEGAGAGGGAEVWESSVYVRREGTAPLPVKVLVEREGEPPILEEWDGRDRWTVFRYRGGKVLRVVVDPEEVWLLDLDLNNNTWQARPDPTQPARWSERVLFWMQNLLLFYTSLS